MDKLYRKRGVKRAVSIPEDVARSVNDINTGMAKLGTFLEENGRATTAKAMQEATSWAFGVYDVINAELKDAENE